MGHNAVDFIARVHERRGAKLVISDKHLFCKGMSFSEINAFVERNSNVAGDVTLTESTDVSEYHGPEKSRMEIKYFIVSAAGTSAENIRRLVKILG